MWYAAATGTAPWPPGQEATALRVLHHLLAVGADPGIAASGRQGRPIDAARGLHQRRQYRIAWPEAVALLERHG